LIKFFFRQLTEFTSFEQLLFVSVTYKPKIQFFAYRDGQYLLDFYLTYMFMTQPNLIKPNLT
jgi:hypothetical protein